jgi:hypothetical protein
MHLSYVCIHPYLRAFNISMLPCFVGDAQKSLLLIAEDAVAKAAVTASKERFALFAAGLTKDQTQIALMNKGAHCLADLLDWLQLKHKREQVRKGEEAVRQTLSQSFKFLPCATWETAATDVAGLMHSYAVNGVTPACIFLLNLHVPHMRDTLKLPKMFAALEAMLMKSPDKSVALVWMPDVMKDAEGALDADEEEQVIAKGLRAARLKSERIVMMHEPAEGRAGRHKALPWWSMGRLVYAGGSAGEHNLFAQHSELARLRRFRTTVTLPPAEALLHVQSLAPDADLNDFCRTPAQRAAQKGTEVAQKMLHALAEGCESFIHLDMAHNVVVFDFTVHAGDVPVGMRGLRRAMPSLGQWKYVGVGVGRPAIDQLEFGQRRVAEMLTTEWLQGGLEVNVSTPEGP